MAEFRHLVVYLVVILDKFLVVRTLAEPVDSACNEGSVYVVVRSDFLASLFTLADGIDAVYPFLDTGA